MNLEVRRVANAYLQACQMELEALKPGNVSVYADGHGMTAKDFLLSAECSVGPLTDFSLGLGRRIFLGVEQTRQAVGCNTNLGVILLAAPLLQASFDHPQRPLRENLRRVLDATTVEDAHWVFRAICLAAPGGLGQSDRYDVNQTAVVGLLDAMREAAARDQLARQYATGYHDIFEFFLPLIEKGGYRDTRTMTENIFVEILAHQPDTHIRRKYGEHSAQAVQRYAGLLQQRLQRCATTRERNNLLHGADRMLKQRGINPGTSADLTVSTLLARQLETRSIFPVTTGARVFSQTAQSEFLYQP
jgi:triphosphoribosyl-dephospho-CoA synthase